MSSVGPFDLIVGDCPWPETGGGGRGTGNHYETPHVDEIPAIVMGAPVWRPARAFWLGLWATKTHLPDALALMAACGCRYVTTWTWIKETQQGGLALGMGQYGRHGVEYLLWGKRGTIGRNEDAARAAQADFSSPRGKHSAKPSLAYDQARGVFLPEGGLALEMFAREPREGWTVWGNEVLVVDGEARAAPIEAAPTRESILAGDHDRRPIRRLVADSGLLKALVDAHAEATGKRALVVTRERRAAIRQAFEAGMKPSVLLKALEGIALDDWWMGRARGQERKSFDVHHCIRHASKFVQLWEARAAKAAPEAAPSWAEEDIA